MWPPESNRSVTTHRALNRRLAFSWNARTMDLTSKMVVQQGELDTPKLHSADVLRGTLDNLVGAPKPLQ